jgi:hypothetical protein
MRVIDRIERRLVDRLLSAQAHRDLVALAVDETRTWKEIQRAIDLAGDPTALTGGYAGLEVTPPAKDQATVTGSATEQAMWPVTLSPIPVTPQSPKLYRLFASGTSTTAAARRHVHAGRADRQREHESAVRCGVRRNLTPVASATAAQWRCFGVVFVRQSGTTGIAVGTFEFNHSGTVGGGGPVSATGNAIYGGISASTDFTLTTNGLWMGVTHATSTTNTWVPQLVDLGLLELEPLRR